LAAGVAGVEVSYDSAQILTCPCPMEGCTTEDGDGGSVVPSECHVSGPGSEPIIDEIENELATTQNREFYCQIFGEEHTLCKYTKTQASSTCGQVYKKGVSNADIHKILDTHNSMRDFVACGGEVRGKPGPQPIAANMIKLEWDQELADTAQAWANQCQFKHDCGKCRRVTRFLVGQSMYGSMTQSPGNPDWERAISLFYKEVSNLDNNQVDRFTGTGGVGHYTQIVWARTRFIGCGYIQNKKGTYVENVYVCNYGNAGNYLGSEIYTFGPGCSQCPAGSSCDSQYKNLCAFSSGTNPTTKRPTTTQRPTKPPVTIRTTTEHPLNVCWQQCKRNHG